MATRLDLSELWSPQPTQEKFLEAIVNAPDMGLVAYVGALGSGKSWGICRAAIGLCLNHPGIKILLGRHLSTDLRDTTQSTFFALITQLEEYIKSKFPKEEQENVPAIGEYHKSVNEYVFSNGATILFRPLDEAEKKYKSLEIACFGIDEASEVEIEAVRMLIARCRQMGYPHVGFMVSNPTGPSHWLYDWFVRNPQPDYALFRTNTAENLDNLPKGYVDNLRRNYPIDWIRRYLEGEWGGIDDGLPVFPTFRANLHVRPCLYYRRYPVWVGIDFGYHSPAVVWAQQNNDNQIQVIRSWAPKGIDVYKLAEGILARNGQWFPPHAHFLYYCGHDGRQKKDTNEKTSLEVLYEYGIRASFRFHYIERAFTAIRNLLKERDNGTSGIVIDPFNGTMIEGFGGGYRYKPDKEDEVEKTGVYDPLFDALRYIIVNNYTMAGEIPDTVRKYLFKRDGTKNESDDGPMAGYAKRKG